MINIRQPLSFWFCVGLSFVIVYLRFYHPVNNVLSWDVFGYYLYLPAHFIHHDLGIRNMAWVNQMIEQYQNTATFYQAFPSPTGSMVIKYSMGLSILYSPGFFVAHLLAPMLGYPADGLSMPYQISVLWTGIIFGLFGLFVLRKLLLKFFDDRSALLTMIFLLAGTNYLNMAYEGTLLTHNFLFTMYGLILLATVRWHERKTMRNAAWLGILIGFTMLIRPNEGVVLLIPLLWGVWDRDSLKEKLRMFWKQRLQLFLFFGVMVIAGLPQLIYWKIYAGKFLYYSYINPGEGFDFLYPHTWDFLFSFRKGWFIYTPLMLFAVSGFWWMWKKKNPITVSLVLFFVINLYVVSSWSCWWYAGSFSQRAMVQSYPVMALPLGYLFTEILKQKTAIKYFWICLMSLLLALNLFQTWQFSYRWVIHPDRMTRAYYFRVFGKTQITEDDRKLLLVERPIIAEEHFTDSTGYRGRFLRVHNFEKEDEVTKGHLSAELKHSGAFSLKMDSNFIYSPGIQIQYKDITSKDHAWIRITAWVYPVADLKEGTGSLVATFSHGDGVYKYRTADLENPVFKVIPGQWNKVTLDYITPEVRTSHDKLAVYFWLRGKKDIFIDDLSIEAFEKVN